VQELNSISEPLTTYIESFTLRHIANAKAVWHFYDARPYFLWLRKTFSS